MESGTLPKQAASMRQEVHEMSEQQVLEEVVESSDGSENNQDLDPVSQKKRKFPVVSGMECKHGNGI